MKRNIIIQLCGLLWCDLIKVRTIFGICGQYQKWKRHSSFLNKRPTNLTTFLCQNPSGGYTLTPKSAGIQCMFFDDRSVFLDRSLSEGIFRWTIQIHFGVVTEMTFFLGCAPSAVLSCFNERCIGGSTVLGSCSLVVYRGYDGGGSRLSSVDDWDNNDIPTSEGQVTDNSVVAIEADTISRTLTFFVDRKKMAYGISNTAVPLHMGMSRWRGQPGFTSLSFRRVPAPTPSLVVCKLYNCRPAKKDR